jgi:CHAD domain-containing protein
MTLTEKRFNTLARGVSATIAKLQEEVTPKRVHRLRTTIRRIQSLMEYSRPELTRKQQNTLDALSKLRKRAGKVRDLDIQINLLNALGNGSTRADRRALEEALQGRRKHQAERLALAARKLEHSKFAGHLGQLGPAMSASSAAVHDPGAPLHTAQTKIAELAAQSGSQSQIRPRRLHEMRIALKMVRYLAELAEASQERELLLGQLKAVQDALGAWHDWEELLRTAEKQFSHRAHCPLLDEARALFAAKHAGAIAAVSQLFSHYGAAPPRRQPRSVPSRTLVQRAQ